MDLFRAYFWVLVTAAVLGGAYVANEYWLATGAADTRWLAVLGFAALLAVFLLAVRRSVR